MKYLCTHCNFETNHEKDFASHLSSKAHLDQCKQSKKLFEQKTLAEQVEILTKEKDQLHCVLQNAIEDAVTFFEENNQLKRQIQELRAGRAAPSGSGPANSPK